VSDQPEQETRSEAVTTALGMTEALGKLTARLEDAEKYGRRSRKWIWFDIVLTVLGVALGAGLFLASQAAVRADQRSTAAIAKAEHAIEQAAHASASQLEFCRDTNTARHKQILVWDTALTDLGVTKTPEGRTFYVRFNRQLTRIYSPRNCTALEKGGS
jgi:hypothetical protein